MSWNKSKNVCLCNCMFQIFMAYLYLGASTFIIYLQVYEHKLKREHVLATKRTEAALQKQTEGVVNRAFDISNDETEDEEEEEEHYVELPGITVSNDAKERKDSIVSATSDSHVIRRRAVNIPRFMEIGSTEDMPQQYTRFHERRNNLFSLVTLSSEAPDDIYDFIMEHQATATLSGGDTNLFLKAGTLCKNFFCSIIKKEVNKCLSHLHTYNVCEI